MSEYQQSAPTDGAFLRGIAVAGATFFTLFTLGIVLMGQGSGSLGPVWALLSVVLATAGATYAAGWALGRKAHTSPAHAVGGTAAQLERVR